MTDLFENNGYTAFAIAALSGQIDAAEALLKQRASDRSSTAHCRLSIHHRTAG